MNPHRIDVLDRANDDDVVRPVTQHLELELLPADDAALDQHLLHRREIESASNDVLEFLAVVGDAAARTAEGERRPNDRWKARQLQNVGRLPEGGGNSTLRHGEPNPLHGLAKELAIFRHGDGAGVGANQLDAVLLEHATLRQLHRDVERGLPAHRRQQRVRFFLGDDELDILRRYRLDVGAIREFGIGHDRGRIGVDEYDLESFFAERLRRLGARIVELRALADDDRAGADYEDFAEVGSLRHYDANLAAGFVRGTATEQAMGRRVLGMGHRCTPLPETSTRRLAPRSFAVRW